MTHFLLDGKFDSKSLAMRFGPNEAGIDQSDFTQTLEPSKTDGE